MWHTTITPVVIKYILTWKKVVSPPCMYKPHISCMHTLCWALTPLLCTPSPTLILLPNKHKAHDEHFRLFPWFSGVHVKEIILWMNMQNRTAEKWQECRSWQLAPGLIFQHIMMSPPCSVTKQLTDCGCWSSQCLSCHWGQTVSCTKKATEQQY